MPCVDSNTHARQKGGKEHGDIMCTLYPPDPTLGRSSSYERNVCTCVCFSSWMDEEVSDEEEGGLEANKCRLRSLGLAWPGLSCQQRKNVLLLFSPFSSPSALRFLFPAAAQSGRKLSHFAPPLQRSRRKACLVCVRVLCAVAQRVGPEGERESSLHRAKTAASRFKKLALTAHRYCDDVLRCFIRSPFPPLSTCWGKKKSCRRRAEKKGGRTSFFTGKFELCSII